MHADNRKKDISILGKGPTDGVDDTTITAKAEYSINFSEQQNTFFLSLHYNGSSNYLFVNGVKIFRFKVKNFELKSYELCHGNISKDFTVDNMKETRFYGYVYDFSVVCDNINITDITNIDKYLMKKYNIV